MKDIIISAMIILVPALLTAKEPDLGTAITLLMSGACVWNGSQQVKAKSLPG